MYIIICAN